MSHFLKKKCALFIIISNYLHRTKRVSTKRRRRYWATQLYVHRRLNGGEKILRILAADETTGQFYNFLRMSQADFEILLNMIGPKIMKKNTNFRQAISVKERLAITLRFLATGDSFVSLQYLFKVSKQAISLIVPEVCSALIEVLKDYVKIPTSEEEWLAVEKQFETLWNFPNCAGSMDGKHIVLQSPKCSGSDFFNYKGFFSIVLYAVVDADYNFMFADVGCQGRISDGGVFKNTVIHRMIRANRLGLPPAKPLRNRQKEVPYVFVVDEAFPLTENIMKPYAGLHLQGSRERIFNYRLSRARRVVENVFGIMSSVFRLLRKPLLLEPSKAEVVVMAIVHLHNFLRKSRNSKRYNSCFRLNTQDNGQQLDEIAAQDDTMTSFLPLKNMPRKSSFVAKEIREEFAEYFLTNGAVSWQSEYA